MFSNVKLRTINITKRKNILKERSYFYEQLNITPPLCHKQKQIPAELITIAKLTNVRLPLLLNADQIHYFSHTPIIHETRNKKSTPLRSKSRITDTDTLVKQRQKCGYINHQISEIIKRKLLYHKEIVKPKIKCDLPIISMGSKMNVINIPSTYMQRYDIKSQTPNIRFVFRLPHNF